ncbi:carbohydrate ABC transporter permease [Ktedonospora formicarum]|uniref:Sugar ABC transporter permease n=1 Tax=Ktedonospora formicarum TaxID=2778364 RepID=A0A8J3I7H5_9CHLR|nr:sugar ABC transporter permease [Ktedonospora formicarum]GHO50969.1 sugar ABC transporter permease [Ktedonospora formicarum]
MSKAKTAFAASQANVTPRVSRWSHMRQNIAGWIFALPWGIIFLVFMAGPILASLILSFTDFSLGNLANPFDLHFIGFQNYIKLTHDATFLSAALNTVYFVVVGVPLDVAIALLVALGVNQGVGFVKSFFRVGYYLPVVTSIVAVAVVWRYLLDPDAGLINNLLHLVHVQGPNWLGDPTLAMPSIIAMAIWRNIGSGMIIFLAGLQDVDKSLYEAASIDGTNTFQRFRYITLPMIRPTMLFVVVMTSIGFLQVFAEPFVMTGGGPLNRTLTVSIYLYKQGFDFFNLGYASSIAYVMFVVIVIMAVIQFRLLRPQD